MLPRNCYISVFPVYQTSRHFPFHQTLQTFFTATNLVDSELLVAHQVPLLKKKHHVALSCLCCCQCKYCPHLGLIISYPPNKKSFS